VTTPRTTETTGVTGRELPPPGDWTIDPTHSQIEFIARHMMIARTRGRFREYSGTIHIAEVPEQSWVEVRIAAASIDTGDEQRDRHLRSPEFLDVERYPEITFRSTDVRPSGDDHYEVTGDLTIRGITRSVALEVEYCGVIQDPWGNQRAAFLGTTEIDRDEFAVSWNQALEAGGFLVGKGVKVEVDVEAVHESGQAG
jgi:polyisoprenoid-binding protein YceI